MQEITLRKLRNTKFKDIYSQLLLGSEMSASNVIKLLAISVLLINHQALEIRRLGYRIILFYGNSTGRYEALYDIALNSGLHPVSAVLGKSFEEKDHRRDSFLRNIIGSYIETFRSHGIVLTEQQDALNTFIQAEYENSSVVVAPTSYGKSELIIKSIKENANKRVLVLVPSKALLSQTKKRLLDGDIGGLGKIITHPEMHSAERRGRVFVLTQERLSRLLSEYHELYFDMVFVDEAHNILQGDRRNELLATMLCVLGARHSSTAFKFLTPFLCDELNLRIRYLNMDLKGFRIDEYIKSERFYVGDFRKARNEFKLKFYDHFLDEWLDVKAEYKNCFELIKRESLSKNIIYGNKKKSVEAFAMNLASTLPTVSCPLIEQACNELQEIFDWRYRLISCLKKGVMYHHGSIPDTVRLYLEDLFKKSAKMKYLVCNSTLLEGVNLPIERLFLFDYTKGRNNLTSSQFKNLVGRVNRFSEIFSATPDAALKKLEPSVYLLGIDDFTSKRANLEGFYKKTVNITQVDHDGASNVLLEATNIVDGEVGDRYEDAVERLENLQPGIVKGRTCRYVKTPLGILLIANSISEIDVFEEEVNISLKIQEIIEKTGLIDNSTALMGAIKECFINYFDESRKYSDLTRLKQTAALGFYAMILDWKIAQKGIKETVRLTLRYWQKLVDAGLSNYVFVGNWGDVRYGESHYEHWVEISTKNDEERVNLAIVRMKEEGDFFDNKIFRFVEVLFGVGALNVDFYEYIKYGTADKIKIKLIRDGFSRALADLIVEKYPDMVLVAVNGDVGVDARLIKIMAAKQESDILIFEAQMNIKSE